MPSPREEMRIVARRLQPLDVPFVFVGGAVMCLLVDHPELTQIRVTKDVDVIVEVVTYTDYAGFEERLRRAGFQHDISAGAPICRWIVEGCRVDIMPQDSSALGMNSRWFPEALRLAREMDMGEDCRAKVVSASVFLATKLEAFKDRGKGDYFMSHDLEDIVTLVDGRGSIAEEVAALPEDIREFIARGFLKILEHPDFPEALRGHLPAMAGARERGPVVIKRFQAIASLT